MRTDRPVMQNHILEGWTATVEPRKTKISHNYKQPSIKSGTGSSQQVLRSDLHVSIGNIPTSADSVSHNIEVKLMDFSQEFIIYRFTSNTNYRLNERCINPECHAASIIKFCMVAPKTRGSSTWKWLHDTLLASTEFWDGSWIFRNLLHIYTELYSTAFN
jgi:hypothetical protein